MTQSRATELAADANSALATLLTRADAAPDFPLGDAYRGRTVTDVLAHLHAWHLLLARWVAAHRAGEVPFVPAPGYTWAQLDDLNTEFYEDLRSVSYDDVRTLLAASHAEVLGIVSTFSDEELTAADAYAWLGGQSLGFVAHECLGGHYAWAEEVLTAGGVTA